MGDGNMRLISYLQTALPIEFHGSRHEAAAVGMADGYSRATAKVGVCTVTQGPGVTNTMTALVAAIKASSPVVLLAGDIPHVQSGWPQDVDHSAFFAAASVPMLALDDPAVAHGGNHEGPASST